MSVIELAREVYDFERKRTFDRTKEPHVVGGFDADFRARHAPNEKDGRVWTYMSSHASIEEAIAAAKRIPEMLRAEAPNAGPIDVRVVSASTGEVLWYQAEPEPEGGHRRRGMSA